MRICFIIFVFFSISFAQSIDSLNFDKGAILLSHPSTSARTLKTFEKITTLPIIDQNKSYYKVIADKDTGYILKYYSKPIDLTKNKSNYDTSIIENCPRFIVDVLFSKEYFAFNVSVRTNLSNGRLFLGMGYSQTYEGKVEPPGTKSDDVLSWWVRKNDFKSRIAAFTFFANYLLIKHLLIGGGVEYNFYSTSNVYYSSISDTWWNTNSANHESIGFIGSVSLLLLQNQNLIIKVEASSTRGIFAGIGYGF